MLIFKIPVATVEVTRLFVNPGNLNFTVVREPFEQFEVSGVEDYTDFRCGYLGNFGKVHMFTYAGLSEKIVLSLARFSVGQLAPRDNLRAASIIFGVIVGRGVKNIGVSVIDNVHAGASKNELKHSLSKLRRYYTKPD
jgi:hypothetical protein